MEITPCNTAEEIIANYNIITQLYPPSVFKHMEYDSYCKLVPIMLQQGYRQVKATIDEKTVAVASFNDTIRLYLGHIIRVHDLVVDKPFRGQGIARTLVEYMENIAQEENACALVLDATLTKKDNHTFYEHIGFKPHALHFIKKL
jgi:GNAT superfamily N-acetyltransferase